MEDHVPFFRPDIGEEEIAEVVQTLRAGWITTGSKTKQFEEEFSTFLGGGLECLAVNSATAGLHLAVEALGIGPGDEVLVPNFTFTATAEVVRYLGANPVFVDVDETTLNITPEAASAKITSRTKAIMVVHFAGRAADITGFVELARKHNLKIIEDAAHALPSRHNGQLVGSLDSDVTVFSFYANKTITTGEGGMIATRDKDVAARCRVMRLHGIDRDAFNRFSSKGNHWQYDIVAPGFKYNMTDIAASLGIHQLKKAMKYQNQRERLVEKYNEALKHLPLILPAAAQHGDVHSWHLYVVRTTSESPVSRDQLVQALNDKSISCSVHYTPLHRLSYWRDTYKLSAADFPVSERIFQSCLTLPLYPLMTDHDFERTCDALCQILAASN